ncbi:MAG: ribokinase, partial [Proteobacteria bacterium]|nr:ribokinase [Pseudomonadota bacterium]
GGKGANQAIAAARAGADVAMIGCTGKDAAGAELRGYLSNSGVDVSRVVSIEDVPTGTALIVVAQGENSIIVVLGANQHVHVDSVDGLSLDGGDIVMAQLETPVDATLAAFRAARQAGARTILNPSPVAPMPPGLLDNTDVLVVNEHEFEMIFETPLMPVLSGAAVPESFSGVLVVTLGSDGVLAVSGDERIRSAGRPVEVVDSTGAGDCFVGYLAAALHEDASLRDAVELANLAASVSVTRPGAASSLPERQELAAG